ncbi:MAG: SusC/RagA family TonB-linked outer membrane protein [Tidjanibacter sp.]|nr:SusC/RagA family TonB-linked outer membrane protein [Tidjanibacter sp.]
MKKFGLRVVFAVMMALAVSLTSAYAQGERTIKGRIVDGTTGEALVGATVMVKDAQTGIASGRNGEYVIKIKGATDQTVLVYSYMGMEDQEITIGKRTTIDVAMLGGATVMEEIEITTGYGVVQKRSDLTGSAFQVNSESLVQMPAARIDNMLAGLVPGVSIEQGSDATRVRYSTRIRGDASLSASSEPLWIVDGVPIYTGDKTSVAGTSTTVSPLSFINPDDIESMTVLKDAATTALYGADGANGVILVTTKQGRSQKTRLNVALRYGISSLDNATRIKYMNAEQWKEYAMEAWVNSGEKPENFPYRDNEFTKYTGVDTDWFDVYNGIGQTTQVNLSASGGSKDVTNYVSGSYFKQNSTTIGDMQERISLRSKSDYKLSRTVRLNFNLSGSYNNNELFAANGLYTLTELPIYTPFEEDGVTPKLYNYYYRKNAVTGEYELYKSKFHSNEVPNRMYSDNNQKTFSGDANVRLEWEPIKGLTFTSQNGASYTSTAEAIYDSRNTLDGMSESGLNGYSRRAAVFSLTANSINRMNFNRTFGKHKVGALAAIEFVHKEYRQMYVTGRGFANDFIKEIAYADGSSIDGSSNMKYTRSLSYLGQFSYSYDQRYYLTLTARKQGYSSFSKYARFGDFSAIGLSWNMHNEPWFDKSVITLLKFKGSYGNSGNSRVDTSSALGSYAYGDGNTYGGSMGATISKVPNPGLSWENTRTTNVGVMITLLDRITLEVEGYEKYTDNLLYDGRVSMVITDNGVTRNVGEIQNLGIEFTLSTVNVQTPDFEWRTDINGSHNDNLIVKLYKGNHTGFFDTVWMEGASKNHWWLVRWAGVDPATGRPMWYDKNGNLTFSFSYDNRVINPDYSKVPILEGGIINTLRYKNFSLRIQANYQLGGYDMCSSIGIDDGNEAISENASVNAMEHWREPGDLSINPKIVNDNDALGSMGSTRFLYDRTNVQIKTVSLTYTVPKRVCNRLGVRGANVTLLADNPYIWTPGYSPYKNSYQNYAFGRAGRSRTFSAELSLTF